MHRTLLDRIRMVRPQPDRTSWGRRTTPDSGAGFRHGAAGHGSRMPSPRATAGLQRPC
ncbi:hypothetical protein ACE2AJ_08755 [Aquihabitans daechungensis]|uniref:hypothetical protein n=1 Tax=Aquihabitans daechungensis TaxID=1052257 RepID=UPI003B9E77AD